MIESETNQPEIIDTTLDVYLQDMVDLINGTDLEFPITLYLGGTIITGHLVSGHKYFDGLKEQYRVFFNSNDDRVEKLLDDLTAARKNYIIDTETKNNIPLPIYIHIKDAKCFSPGQDPMPKDGVYWRGKLSSVDGFHFGRLERQLE